MTEDLLKEIHKKYKVALNNKDLDEAIKQAKLKMLSSNDDPSAFGTAFTNKMHNNFEKGLIKTDAGLVKAQKEGWEVLKRNKTSWSLQREKEHSIGFEQKCWSIFAKMQFTYLNDIKYNQRKELSFKIPFKLENGSIDEKQIDIFAANEEIVIIGECKSSSSLIPKTADHKGIVKEWNNDMDAIRSSVRKMFGRDIKVAFLWMTNNYKYGPPTTERLELKGWHHFNQDSIKYFATLSIDLGKAAGYQLIGKLFEGKKIPSMENKFPGIKDKIGGNDCYIFSCIPEFLLKIGYVVHQSDKTGEDDAFQRLVKPSRLKNIRQFISDGGFFPNSIIININGSKKLFNGWKPIEKQDHDSESELGIIELPQVYRSAFIIDGQHRLYGYTQQEKGIKYNSVPVVMFYNLKTTEQTQIFEQINATQKAPPASLIDIIKSDLNWDSDNQYEMVQALKSRIFVKLANDTNSPFYNRIVVGEEITTDTRCLNLNTIKNQGMGVKTQYFGSFLSSNGDLDTPGFLWRTNKQEMLNNAILFIKSNFSYIEKHFPEQWNIGKKEGGLLSMNIGVVCFLKLFELLISHEVMQNKLKPRNKTGDNLAEVLYPYLDVVIDYFKLEVSPQKIKNMRDSSRGSGGYKNILGAFLYAVNKHDDSFNHPLIKEYKDNESGVYNEPARVIVDKVEKTLLNMVEQKFQKEFGTNWWDDAIQADVKNDCAIRRNNEDEEYKKKGKEPRKLRHFRYLLTLDYMKIIKEHQELFSSAESIANGKNDLYYVCPTLLEGEQGYKKKLNWLDDFNTARKQSAHSGTKGPVTLDSYNDLLGIEQWFDEKSEAFIKNI